MVGHYLDSHHEKIKYPYSSHHLFILTDQIQPEARTIYCDYHIIPWCTTRDRPGAFCQCLNCLFLKTNHKDSITCRDCKIDLINVIHETLGEKKQELPDMFKNKGDDGQQQQQQLRNLPEQHVIDENEGHVPCINSRRCTFFRNQSN